MMAFSAQLAEGGRSTPTPFLFTSIPSTRVTTLPSSSNPPPPPAKPATNSYLYSPLLPVSPLLCATQNKARICRRLRSPGINSARLYSLAGRVRQIGLSYRPARLGLRRPPSHSALYWKVELYSFILHLYVLRQEEGHSVVVKCCYHLSQCNLEYTEIFKLSSIFVLILTALLPEIPKLT